MGNDNLVRLWEISTPNALTVPDFPEGLTGPNVETWSEDQGYLVLRIFS